MRDRHSRRFATLLAAAVCAPAAGAQIASTVGPADAPIGCEIVIAISNDTAQTTLLGQFCPFNVRTAQGALVYSLDCPSFAAIPIDPGTEFVTRWDTRDDFGNPVPPGDYVVEVELPTGVSEFTPITIGNTQAGIAQVGVMRIGTTHGLEYCAPQDPGFLYLTLASLAELNPGIPTCGGFIPLVVDALFLLALDPNLGLLPNGVGLLDSDGRTTAPGVALPNNPNLVGVNLSLAYVVLDPSGPPCAIRNTSPALSFVIQ